MNILLLYDEGQEKAGRLLEEGRKRELPMKGRLFRSKVDEYPLPDEAWMAATHFLAVFPDDGASRGVSLWKPPRWFTFALGFSIGSRRPLACYGLEASALPPLWARGRRFFSGEAALFEYLDGESRDWSARERRREARGALLDLGIRFSLESMEQAIEDGDERTLSYFLMAGFSPNSVNVRGVPALCQAVRAGNRRIAAMLLAAGAQVNFPAEDRGGTALIDCALVKDPAMMADLLAAGAHVNVKTRDGQSALIIAVGLHDLASARMLLEAGASPDDPDQLGVSARKYAALFNKGEMVALFQKYPEEKTHE